MLTEVRGNGKEVTYLYQDSIHSTLVSIYAVKSNAKKIFHMIIQL